MNKAVQHGVPHSSPHASQCLPAFSAAAGHLDICRHLLAAGADVQVSSACLAALACLQQLPFELGSLAVHSSSGLLIAWLA